LSRRRTSALIAALAAALPMEAPAREPAPFALADVDFEADCRPNSAFERLLTVFLGAAAAGDAADAAVYDAVAGDAFHRLILDEPAEWHGLRLKGIDLYLGIERGPANYTLIFDNSLTEVREVWSARGWKLPAVGERRDIDGLEGYAAIGLDGIDGAGAGAAVTCFRD
jgi:hypothetical protein